MSRDMNKWLPVLAIVAGVVWMLILRKNRRRPMRSFREDPVGALKDRTLRLRLRASDAGEEALERIQEALEEMRERLPEMNGRRGRRKKKEIRSRLYSLSEQAQELVRELRANAPGR